jgi:hypothetical protein
VNGVAGQQQDVADGDRARLRIGEQCRSLVERKGVEEQVAGSMSRIKLGAHHRSLRWDARRSSKAKP